jgi:hypothetical protein
MPMHAIEVYVSKGALTDAALAERPLAPPVEGGVRLAVESFAVTANNVTYAAAEGTIAIKRHKGLDAGRGLFCDMLANRIDPARGIVIEP